MFYCISGKIIMTDAQSVAVDCSGVGFRCFTSINTLKKIGKPGENVTLLTHLSVREDALDLFGFSSNEELSCFKLLISVTGVGPKAALAVLSELSPEKLALCIATGDTKTITRAQGVGPKLAQRMVLELKDKLASNLPAAMDSEKIEAAGIASASGNAAEAVSALAVLGYSQSEASVTVSKIDSSLSVEEIIKQALKLLSKRY